LSQACFVGSWEEQGLKRSIPIVVAMGKPRGADLLQFGATNRHATGTFASFQNPLLDHHSIWSKLS
jgi:hypothetical protein